MYVLDRKVEGWIRGGRLGAELAHELLETTVFVYASLCAVIDEPSYTRYEREARQRIPDDPDDWHTVALALTTKTVIWTLDQKHFFGCGMAVWNTRVLRAILADHGSEGVSA